MGRPTNTQLRRSEWSYPYFEPRSLAGLGDPNGKRKDPEFTDCVGIPDARIGGIPQAPTSPVRMVPCVVSIS